MEFSIKELENQTDQGGQNNDNQWNERNKHTGRADGDEPDNGCIQQEHSESDCQCAKAAAGAFL